MSTGNARRFTRTGRAAASLGLVAASCAHAWPLSSVNAARAGFGVVADYDPPIEVIEHGLTMLTTGERFSSEDLWSVAWAIRADEYTVIIHNGLVFTGGELIRIGVGFGQAVGVGETVPTGVYWNQSDFAIKLTDPEDPTALVEIAPNALLSVGPLSDLRLTAGPGGTQSPKIICQDGYSACCIPSHNPPIMRCLSSGGDFSACEGGGKGASSCTLDGFVECRDGYYACGKPSDQPPTSLCRNASAPDDDCEWGGQGTAACGPVIPQ